MYEFEHKKIKQKLLDLTQVKAVIFDFDDTLYSGGDWSDFFDICTEFLVAKGFGNSKNEIFDMLEAKYPNIHNFGMRVCNYAKENGYDVNILYDYLNENIYDISNANFEFMDYAFLEKLSKLMPIYLVSNSPENYVKHYAKEFGINLNFFEKVYYNRHEGEDFSKLFYIKKCIELAGVLPEETLMVGDDLYSDIHFGKLAGCQTFYVTRAKDTEKLIKKLINSKTIK